MLFQLFLLWLMLANVLDFFLMLADKRFAMVQKRRVPERVLLCLAVLGGSAGAMFAMRLFRHKTQHKRFSVGLPLMTLGWCAVVLLLSGL